MRVGANGAFLSPRVLRGRGNGSLQLVGLLFPLLGKSNTVVPGFSVLGFRALPGFRALCTGNQSWIYVIILPGFSVLRGFKAPFHGDGQSALNPGTTVS